MICPSQTWPLLLSGVDLGEWLLIDTISVFLLPRGTGFLKVLFFRRALPSGRFVPWRYRIRSHPDVLVCQKADLFHHVFSISKGMFKSEPYCFGWNVPIENDEIHPVSQDQPVLEVGQVSNTNFVDFSNLSDEDVMKLSEEENSKPPIFFPRLSDDLPQEFQEHGIGENIDLPQGMSQKEFDQEERHRILKIIDE